MGSQKGISEPENEPLASEGEYQYEGEGENQDGDIAEINEEEQYSDNQNYN